MSALDIEAQADDALWARRMREASGRWVDCAACDVTEEEALAAGEDEEAAIEEVSPCASCGGLREVWAVEGGG